ncbi:AMP-dependent synthetase [Nocardioides sp. Root190]|uniref:AMP-binding protein n=1 Tax=Nocardioides sp. Root190 TaxID=1736488 RepID=UPI0006F36070|nr:AMP-binding protein [Nocardioides sp. Root190]KRB78467.1 AMP-dependent synthetase [Nocardioides sp. Root190]
MFYPLTINDFIDRAVTVFPDRTAVHDDPLAPVGWEPLTYRQVAERARSLAASLDALGLPVGARVAVLSQNSSRLLTSFYGVSGFGRVLVPVNFRLTAAEVRYIVEHSGAEVLLVDPSLRDVAEQVGCRHTFVFGEDDEQLWTRTDAPRPWDGDESATATINYTSGTTARPKGVQLTHRNLWLNAVTFGWHLGVAESEVYLHTLPMFHANGWGMPYAITGFGGTHVVLRQVDGAEILRRVAEHGVTLMCAAPAVLSAVLEAARGWEGEIPGRQRVRVVVAGAPPPTRLIERIRNDLGWEFIQIYGLTETSPFLTMSRMREEWRPLPGEEQARLLGRAGAPAIGVRVAIAGDGEVLVASNHNLEAYWQNPEETERAQEGGVFHTGDGGSFADGCLTIKDRKKDVIVTGGENVSSIEVEDVLASHPAVAEAAVIGIPDEKWGELVTALVVTTADVSEEELIAHCRARLAGYKTPKRIDFRAELARTATGKLQKFKLRQDFWSDRDRQVN